uniref:NADH dehydrogenase subunit 6 n=1 Tax=Modiolus modiolus TaxID=40256 RepID=A0A1L7H858_MODMO|nr:NADH dehydrogenase subunit 6 [Modiolus modiolus]APU51262.1 NADH dehydrogenase subunit 6 [Modiolus modiolus]
MWVSLTSIKNEFGFFCGVVMFLCLLVLSVWESLYIGLILGVMSICVSIILGSSMSSLAGYFVFLIYVGGLMVLFGYVLSVFPNQYFAFGFLPGKFLFSLFMAFSLFSVSFKSESASKLGGFLMFNSSAYMYLFVGGFLLFVLILVVSLCKKRHLPLRGGLFGQ